MRIAAAMVPAISLCLLARSRASLSTRNYEPEYNPVDLYCSAVGRRHDRVSEGRQQNLSDHLTTLSGIFTITFRRNMADVIMAALLVVFAIRLTKTRKFMPSGLMLILTLAALALRHFVA
jgi:Transmembrane proteins 14C